MIEETTWGMPVIAYLFFAGLGAGALTVGASVFLRGGHGGFGGAYFRIARYGALAAPIPVALGTFFLIFELGSFQSGHWFRWLNLYKVINLSPMSIGTWLLTFFLIIAVLFAATFLSRDANPQDRWKDYRAVLAWIAVPLGIGVAVYTGILLGAMPARPFWNSPVLALLFLLSSLSTGVAVIMLLRAIFYRSEGDAEVQRGYHEGGYLLSATDILLIGFELMAIFLFLMFAQLTVGDVAYAVDVILFGGTLATLFWVWVVVVGLLLPGMLGLWFVAPRLLYGRSFAIPRSIDVLLPVAVLVGGFMLRYVVVIAGQITGPVGI